MENVRTGAGAVRGVSTGARTGHAVPSVVGVQRGYLPPTVRRPSSPGRGAGPVRGLDRDRPARLRLAAAVSGGMLAAALALGAVTGALTPPAALLWAVAAAVLFAVLAPPRITAGGGVLTVRTPLRTRRVRLDRLAAARVEGHTARRVLLRDTAGRRAELDACLLAECPLLRHELDAGLRRSHTAGLLPAADAGAVRDLLAAADARDVAGLADQPTWTRGRRERSGSASRSTSRVTGATSPWPKRKKRRKFANGLPSVHSK